MSVCYADVDVGFKADMARIEGLTLDGEFDNDSDGTQTGVLPLIDRPMGRSPRFKQIRQ
jgi:hypothetical protein